MVVTVLGEMMSLHVKEYTYRITENDVSEITCSYKVENADEDLYRSSLGSPGQSVTYSHPYNNHTRLFIFNRKHR